MDREKIHKIRMAIFVFENEKSFMIHDTVSYFRIGGGLVSTYPG